MDLVWISVIAGIFGGIVVLYFARYVLRQDQGSEKIIEASEAIKEGGLAFIHREYRAFLFVVLVIAIILGLL